MKKLHITIILFLWCFAQVADAQNMYRNYLSNYVLKPESAVSGVHSNGYVYFFQSDTSSQMLSVTEIDPYSMLPTGNNYYLPTSFGFVLNGAFEGFSGDMVLFGYDWNNSTWNWYPAVMVVKNNFSNVYLYECNITGSPFVSGCSGYDINGEQIYALVAGNGKLYATNVANPSLFREFTPNSNFPFSDFYSDISWDADHGMFIASGSAMPTNHDHLHPFVEMLKLNIPQFAQNTASALNVFSYILDNIAYEKITEHKALHVQLCKDDLLLYRDLQEDYNYFVHDIIWMTRINNFWNSSATVSESYYYLLPDAKLTAKDMIYDFENKRANLLCEFSHCVEGLTQLLAQKKIFVNGETTRKIFIKDNHQFICDGFEGNIRYWVYNMKGKLLQQGITKNGKHNLVKATKGIYLLKVSDAVGCPVVKKIVIL